MLKEIKKEIEELHRLALDWEENGLFTKLNQTDINAIGVIMNELELANNKLEKIKDYVKKQNSISDYDMIICGYRRDIKSEVFENVLSIIEGDNNE